MLADVQYRLARKHEMSGRTRDRIPSTKMTRYLPEIAEETSHKFQNLYYRSDRPALSDTGTDTPECVELGSSGSSGSSTFSWADPRDSEVVAEEWEKIQRTLYGEPGPKVVQKRLSEECEQWKTLFPHLRLIGKKCVIHKTENDRRLIKDAVFENNLNDYGSDLCYVSDPKNYKNSAREKLPNKVDYRRSDNSMEEINPRVHIAPVNSSKSLTVFRVGTTSSIVRSELSSSKWRHQNVVSPEYPSLIHINNNNINKDYSNRPSIVSRDNSATSLYSISSKNNVKNEVQSCRKKTGNAFENGHEKYSILEPISFSKIITDRSATHRNCERRNDQLRNKNISLPPLQHEEKVVKNNPEYTNNYGSKKHKKNKSLTPLDIMPGVHSATESKRSAYLHNKTLTKRPNFITTVKNS